MFLTEIYFDLSCYPISVTSELDMELLSDIVTWGEMYTNIFEEGTYVCAQCQNALYSSNDKWKGPCVWPSFRKAVDSNAILSREVVGYNNYTCAVKERYCCKCRLFLGHQFEDGIAKGDKHPDARWRE